MWSEQPTRHTLSRTKIENVGATRKRIEEHASWQLCQVMLEAHHKVCGQISVPDFVPGVGKICKNIRIISSLGTSFNQLVCDTYARQAYGCITHYNTPLYLGTWKRWQLLSVFWIYFFAFIYCLWSDLFFLFFFTSAPHWIYPAKSLAEYTLGTKPGNP